MSIFGMTPILEIPPLRLQDGLDNIKNLLNSNRCFTLWDLSVWEDGQAGLWKDWNLWSFPEDLKDEAKNLKDLLHGITPIKTSARGKRGLGSFGNYTAVVGYRKLCAIPNVPPNPASWKAIWWFKSLPKFDLFILTLTHKIIMTSEVMKKKWWEGPSRCSLCHLEE